LRFDEGVESLLPQQPIQRLVERVPRSFTDAIYIEPDRSLLLASVSHGHGQILSQNSCPEKPIHHGLLVVAAEYLEIRKIFTFDRNHFTTYRFRRGRRLEAFIIVG